MPESRPSIRFTRKTEKPERGRARDARAADVGLDSAATEEQGRGVGFADEAREADTEHKSGRTDEG